MKRCPTCGGAYDGAASACPLDATPLVSAPDPLPPPDAGLTFTAKLGEGALGEVFAARDESGREVAVKRLKPGPSKSPTLRERFLREARLASRVTSPHVVVVHDVVDRGQPLLVMELVDGETLGAALASGLPLACVRRSVVLDLARALAAAHAASVLHRDVKPANVLVDRATGRAKLADFGLARVLGDDRLTATGELLGTPRYLAPEAALGRAEAASDLYSLGCVWFELVTGRPPFVGTIREVLVAHAQVVAPVLLGGEGGEAALVAKLLAKVPGERLTAAEVVEWGGG